MAMQKQPKFKGADTGTAPESGTKDSGSHEATRDKHFAREGNPDERRDDKHKDDTSQADEEA